MLSLDELITHSTAVLFKCLAGSRAYGTATSDSDEDFRGIFAVPAGSYLNLVRPPDQVGDERGNTVFYSLRRVIELLLQANPNVLELLFMPNDCVLTHSPEMQLLIDHRHRFVTQKCADTHVGYAMSQIKRARGQNKWINNPKPVEPPTKDDFCHIIPWAPVAPTGRPSRPLRLSETGWSLSEYHAAKLEHVPDTYRLYHYGSGARGVFRGDLLVCESIPERDESTHFRGLLIFNEQAWKQALVDHKNYWSWRHDRNDARWRQQESGELDFDAKNMMHTVRLLLSGQSIMECGRPIVRFDGEPLALLMSIRQGTLSFDEIMAIANAIMDNCRTLQRHSSLPHEADIEQASALLAQSTDSWEQRTT